MALNQSIKGRPHRQVQEWGASPEKRHRQAFFLLPNNHEQNVVLPEVRGHYNIDA
jgi:hypothetical protein